MSFPEKLWLFSSLVEDYTERDFFHELICTEHGTSPSLTNRDKVLVSVLEERFEPRIWTRDIWLRSSSLYQLYHGLGHTVLLNFLYMSKPSQPSLTHSTGSYLSISVLQCTTSFLTLSIRVTNTKLVKHNISRTFTPNTSLTSCLCPIQRIGDNNITPLQDTCTHLYKLLNCSAHFSALALFRPPHSFCVQYPFHILHPIPLVTPST